MTERRHPLSRRPVRTPAAQIMEFFEELDGRINGTVGSNTRESRSELAAHRPLLAGRARKDPDSFVAEIPRHRTAMRAHDE